ncbi:MAG: hypothetical protein ACREDE_09010, partial [Thermoplasmata archaeon]
MTVEFDTFSAAVGLGLITGALALVAPFLDALTAALAALATAGWLAGRPREPRRLLEEFLSLRGVGLWCVALGAGAFFLLSGPFDGARALALAASL